MKEDELKLCPFCGAEAYISDTWNTTKCVECTVCGCKTMHFKNKLDAIARWNRRIVPKIAPNAEKDQDTPE